MLNKQAMKHSLIYTTDFIRLLARVHHRDQSLYRRLLDEVLQGISTQLAAGHAVQLTGFGTFYPREQPAGSMTSFQTGKRLVVPAHRVAAFRVGRLLKRAMLKRPVGRPSGSAHRGITAALLRASHLISSSAPRAPRTVKR